MPSREQGRSLFSHLMGMLRVVRNSYVPSSARIYPCSVFKNSQIGIFSYLSYFQFVNQTIISQYCSIGMSFKSGLGMHPTQFLSTSPVFFSATPPTRALARVSSDFVEHRSVTIGNDVWIGAGVTIMDGIKIGDGAIVGAGCIVTKNIAPYSIVAGVPNRVIGSRFDDSLVEKLLTLCWWDFDLRGAKPDELELLFTGTFTAEKFYRLERLCRNLARLADA